MLTDAPGDAAVEPMDIEGQPESPGTGGARSTGAADLPGVRERAAASREAAVVSREHAVDDREQAVGLREVEVGEREEAADRRDAMAARRDHVAEERDEAAEERDKVAEERDDELVEVIAEVEPDLPPEAVETLTDTQISTSLDRSQAGEDRRSSAGDRSHAEADRMAAAEDRKLGADERQSALFDDLTGVLRRGPGLHQISRELARVKRSGETLVVGFMDVVGLKAVNDSQGHQAGDALIRAAAAALRDDLRPYDTVLRYGGDEFVCSLVGLDEAAVRARLSVMTPVVADDDDLSVSVSVTIGLASLQEGDSLEALIRRADADLYRQRLPDDAATDPGLREG